MRCSLKRQLLRGGEVMLLAAYFAVVLGRHFEEFKAAVSGEDAALVAQRLHRPGIERLEIYCDSKILVEDLQTIDAADGGGNGKAHGVAQALFGSDGAVAHEFAAASKTFHP